MKAVHGVHHVFPPATLADILRPREGTLQDLVWSRPDADGHRRVFVVIDPSGTVLQRTEDSRNSMEGVVTFLATSTDRTPTVRVIDAITFAATLQPMEAVMRIQTYVHNLRTQLVAAGAIRTEDPIYILVEHNYAQAASRYFVWWHVLDETAESVVFVQDSDEDTGAPVGISPTTGSFCDWAENMMAAARTDAFGFLGRAISGDWHTLREQMARYTMTKSAKWSASKETETRRCSGKPALDDLVQALLLGYAFLANHVARFPPAHVALAVEKWKERDRKWRERLRVLRAQRPAPPRRTAKVVAAPLQLADDRDAHLLFVMRQLLCSADAVIRTARGHILRLVRARRAVPAGFHVREVVQHRLETWRQFLVRLYGGEAEVRHIRAPIRRVSVHARVHPSPLLPPVYHQPSAEPATRVLEAVSCFPGPPPADLLVHAQAVIECSKLWAAPPRSFTPHGLQAYVDATEARKTIHAMVRLCTAALCAVPVGLYSVEGFWAITPQRRRTYDWASVVPEGQRSERRLVTRRVLQVRRAQSAFFPPPEVLPIGPKKAWGTEDAGPSGSGRD
jgi:hypothetical protein